MRSALIIGYVWPEPRSSAAGTYMLELIELLRGADWQVTFASTAAVSPHRFDLSTLCIPEHSIELNNSSFDHYVRELNPDLVIFDRYMIEEQFGWRVEEQCPNALRLLLTQDLHALRDARHRAHKQQRSMNSEDLKSEIAIREISAIYRSDLTLIISDFEMALLQSEFKLPATLLHHTPFMLDTHRLNAGLPFQERQHFATIGTFRHAPNWDSVLWLREAIWPLIRQQLPEAELHIYGSYPPPKATALHNPKLGFHIKGWADSVDEVMQQHRVCLAPLRFGAGIKGKLADAMLNGTPSVTTSIGAEGMAGDHPWPGSVADEPEAIADAAVALYQDQARWQQAQAEGFALIQARYDRQHVGQSLLNRLDQHQAQLQQQRAENFTGAMLRHHLHKSTRYMAQWIEAKNRTATQEKSS